VKRRILLGTFALSSGYQRRVLRPGTKGAVTSSGATSRPSLTTWTRFSARPRPSPPFVFGAKVDDPLAMYLADVFTVPASLAGLPAISVPSGLSTEGLPIGMQFHRPRRFRAAPLRVGEGRGERDESRRRSSSGRGVLTALLVGRRCFAFLSILLSTAAATAEPVAPARPFTGREGRRVEVSEGFTVFLVDGTISVETRPLEGETADRVRPPYRS